MTTTHLEHPALLSPDLLELLARSRSSLQEACAAPTTSGRYVNAQLAALRAAAAVLAHKAPRAVGSRPRNVWDTVAHHVPELGEWMSFFARSARHARAVEAGVSIVSVREADDLAREAQNFLDAVLFHVGLPPTPAVTTHMAPAAVR